jgi:hypothetical protein
MAPPLRIARKHPIRQLAAGGFRTPPLVSARVGYDLARVGLRFGEGRAGSDPDRKGAPRCTREHGR